MALGGPLSVSSVRLITPGIYGLTAIERNLAALGMLKAHPLAYRGQPDTSTAVSEVQSP